MCHHQWVVESICVCSSFLMRVNVNFEYFTGTRDGEIGPESRGVIGEYTSYTTWILRRVTGLGIYTTTY